MHLYDIWVAEWVWFSLGKTSKQFFKVCEFQLAHVHANTGYLFTFNPFGCVTVYDRGFHLHFPGDQWFGASFMFSWRLTMFSIIISYLDILFYEIPIQVLLPIFFFKVGLFVSAEFVCSFSPQISWEQFTHSGRVEWVRSGQLKRGGIDIKHNETANSANNL